MTDPWARPTDRGDVASPDGVVEIELDGPDLDGRDADVTGHDDTTDDTPWDEQSPRPVRHKMIAAAVIAGVVAAAIVAAVVVTNDESTDSTAPEASADVSTITTPETLPPLTAATVPPVATAPIISGAPHLPLENPTYPTAPLPSDLLGRFTLDAETVAENVANRVSIEVISEDDGEPLLIVLEHDPIGGRYRIEWDDGPVEQMIVDTDGALYRAERGQGWDFVADAEQAERTAEQLSALLRSPVRAETLATGVAHADTAVVLDSGAVVRRYTMTVAAFRIPEWTTGQNGPPAPDGGHVFEAYVDEQGRLAVVQGSVVVDGIRRLIMYRFDHNADVTIPRPAVDVVESSRTAIGRRLTEGP